MYFLLTHHSAAALFIFPSILAVGTRQTHDVVGT